MTRVTDVARPHGGGPAGARAAAGRTSPYGPTPTGAHRAAADRRSAPASPRLLQLTAMAAIVFVLALMLVTTIEVVVDRPLSGGSAGHTTLGDVLRPER